ncbi:ABC transporter ATP-binding protein [Psychrosphaera haliotis]|uniref:ATP-binding cassette domain-containing protein n=1 Tax=Psychrosphaera haliotis TaxID=555083 RepID=A0A6N8F9H9_9GAMM|nr:ABC transporter ATP-binding protein [Psychrosphaera haliotis]MUH72814.1 ATP-binding cassette domain-containing protein [Psychrosphaera haliotis]
MSISSSNPVISAESLSVVLNNKKILTDLNFNVKSGEVFALLGGNGAGKSTTLKTFLGMITPTSGSAKILNLPVDQHATELRQKIAYLPESVMLYAHLTARENIKYFLSLAGINKRDDEINHALEKVSLQPKAWDERLSQYSKGMRQKTAIALSILRQAPIFFLDEPTSGLDPIAIDEFNQLVSQLASSGATIMMVTHDVYGACQVANHISLLRDGQLVGNFSSPEQGHINTEEVHAAFAARSLA